MKGILKQYFTMICLISLFLAVPMDSFAKTTLRVGYLPILDHLTLLISHDQDNGSFQEIQIETKMFRKWHNMVGALQAGVIDACFILSPLAIELFNSGTDIKTILLAHRDGSAITIRNDSTIRTVADLKGKAIAIPHRKATHTALLDSYLRTGGLSLKDVITKVIAPPHMEIAMKTGSIEAFIVAEPFGAKAQSNNIGTIHILTKDILRNHVECIVIVKNQFLITHPKGIQEWTESLIRSGKFIDQDKLNNNARDVAKIAAQYLPHTEQLIIDGLGNPSDRISFSNLNPDITDFQKIADISVQAEIIRPADLNLFIDARFYQSAQKP